MKCVIFFFGFDFNHLGEPAFAKQVSLMPVPWRGVEEVAAGGEEGPGGGAEELLGTDWRSPDSPSAWPLPP